MKKRNGSFFWLGNGKNNGGGAMKKLVTMVWCVLMVVFASGCPEDSSWGKDDLAGDVVRQVGCLSDDDCATGKCMDDGSCKDECISAFNCYETYGAGGLVCVNGRCGSTAGQDANWVPAGNNGSSGGNNGGNNNGSANGNNGEQPPVKTECTAGEVRFCGLSQNLNKGECHPGEQTCGADNKWADCVGGISPTPEVCDGKDNDCDGYSDEAFNLKKDVDNCGECGNKCATPNASATCVAGNCVYACQSSFVDLNGFESDGCEFQCLPTWAGIEKCDGLDNDCDGLVDEDFNLLTDVNNCGQCGNKCEFANAKAMCFYGNCVAEKCDVGFADANEDAADGCECQLVGPEVCDGFADEDCDSEVDEGCPCVVGAICGSQVGECQMGVSFCLADGSKQCVGEIKSQMEVCDYSDNDCDGQKDEDFDLLTDVDNCGFCGVICGEPNAGMVCVDGECELVECNAGWYDIDQYSPGCEYPCWFTGAEKCNGVDDDCDGEADEDFGLFDDVDNCGKCGNICSLYKVQPMCFFGKCMVATCDAGFVDLDEDPLNGCEYKCTAAGVELCDVAMVDEDCDGSFNEDCKCADGDTKSVGTDKGVCQKCTQTCVDGQWSDCVGGVSATPEVCDYSDNDCDGSVDEDFSLMADPVNCGWCGHVCTFSNANALCVAGLCKMGGCTGFYHDVNNDPADGCEYACVPSGVEKCNGVDDDCDGQVDEDFNFFNDLNNCGQCGKVCNLWQVSNNVCFFGKCLVDGCNTGYVDLDGQPENGCEYKCTTTGAEVCDIAMVDEDCDGSANEGCGCVDGETKTGGTDEGECVACTQTCVGGKWGLCLGGKTPAPELCNNADDDCDGSVDEDFNTQTDTANCGWCGHSCSFANAQAMCVDGECKLGACDKLFYDADKDAVNGCEYLCLNAGVEKCNGVDDNCDGLVDEGFDLSSEVSNCGQCGNVCSLYKAFVSCDDGECIVSWCQPGFYDLDGQPENGCEYKCTPSGVELCDAGMKDEDCDGSFNEDCKCKDEEFMLVGSDEGECEPCLQFCLGGEWTDCVGGVGAVPELCDSKDNDCDGAVDNGFNMQTDPANCGWCGNECWFPRAQALCGNGKCLMGACDALFYDADKDASNGCEYLCLNAGVEKCNGVDDDCDGLVDEDFNVQSDSQNCGQCGNVCSLDGAVAKCEKGKCAVDSCLPNRFDLDGVAANGCEYVCVFAGPEDCDASGKDEDCDGSFNEGCSCKNGETKTNGTDEGLCKVCTQTCVAGKWGECLGGKSAVPEICDGFDNDCDEQIDEDFNLAIDPLNCGKCGNKCSFANASAACVNGVCQLVACDAMYYNVDGIAANGCEYGPCVVQGGEQCDGFDNDCDGKVDEDFAFASDPSHCGGCDTNCALLPHVATVGCSAGECTVLSCDSSYYDLNKVADDGCEYDCPFKIPGKEVCGDGLDNDCDGKVDNGCPLNLLACDFVCPAGYVPVVWWGGAPGYSWEGATNNSTWSASAPQVCERGENLTIPAESGWIDFNCKNGNLYQWTPSVVASCYYTGGGQLTYSVRVGVIDPGGEGEIVFVNVCL
ncbi:MAG: MopE-related protein [Candidatus Falkowbacteria bacterium]